MNPHPLTAPCISCGFDWTMDITEASQCRGWTPDRLDYQWCDGSHNCPSCKAIDTVMSIRIVIESPHYDDKKRAEAVDYFSKNPEGWADRRRRIARPVKVWDNEEEITEIR